jgi:hypothetical protein
VNDPYLPEEDSPAEDPPAWGFRITLVLVGVYVVYRIGQVIWWAIGWAIDAL